MIYATCLNEQTSIVNEESFMVDLIIENVQLQLQIIQENSIGDKIKNFISLIRKVLDNFIKFITDSVKKIKEKISSIFNKDKSVKNNDLPKDYKVSEFVYDMDKFYKFSDELEHTVNNIELNNYVNIDIDNVVDKYYSIIGSKNITDIDMTKITTIHCNKKHIQGIISELKLKIDKVDRIRNVFKQFCDDIIDDCSSILDIIKNDTDNKGSLYYGHKIINAEIQGKYGGIQKNSLSKESAQKAANNIIKLFTSIQSISMNYTKELLLNISQCVSYNSKLLLGNVES